MSPRQGLSFNRTTMELKRWNRHADEGRRRRLLIEPLWNWNGESSGPGVSTGGLLIEPLWNWNFSSPPFIELFSSLLIEPLWNWNSNQHQQTFPPSLSFNRTTMELKRPFFVESSRLISAFNRTTMELKRIPWPLVPHVKLPFNRTTMELKPRTQQPFTQMTTNF